MDEEFSSGSPRFSPKRSRLSRRESSEESKHRLKREITRELIDFDVIKGSAFFHTKPSNHDKKVLKEGILRVLFLPLHAKYWRQKPHAYEIGALLYLLHAFAIGVYFFSPKNTSVFNSFEVMLPIVLLLLIAVGYGRVSSTLHAGDIDPSVKIVSTSKLGSDISNVSTSSDSTDASTTTTGLGDEIAESENSDSTDSEEDSGNSSSSSDEAHHHDNNMFASAASIPTEDPRSPRLPRTTADRRESVDQTKRRLNVCVWDNGVPTKRYMSIAELRNTILAKVKATPPRSLYRKIAKLSALTLSLVPLMLRTLIKCQEFNCIRVLQDPLEFISFAPQMYREFAFDQLQVQLKNASWSESLIALSCALSTYYMAFSIFTALADAEVTYHRRFLYAKCFTALTSSRRSRQSNLPHFRLKNVVNIKAWISLRGGRTWLKRQGRQRAADEIVSSLFLINLIMLVVMGMQAVSESTGSQNLLHIEVTVWCMLASIFMLRFMMLGSNINKKYQNTSLLLTEQMNVYLRLLVKPHKKEKLLVSNNVLKLASKLLKELNPPNKVSGLTMNPLLYNITRVVVLSAFSSTASEFFGFKLKLWKMKAV